MKATAAIPFVLLMILFGIAGGVLGDNEQYYSCAACWMLAILCAIGALIEAMKSK